MNYCEDNNCKHYGNKEQCEKTHCYYRCYSKLYTKLKRKEQECEELKQENEELKKQVRFKNQFRDYAHKYKQCLNEIEKMCKHDCKECLEKGNKSELYCVKCINRYILDTIKQAKEDENERN